MQCQNSDVEVFSQLDAGFFRRRREYVDIRFSWRVLCACTLCGVIGRPELSGGDHRGRPAESIFDPSFCSCRRCSPRSFALQSLTLCILGFICAALPRPLTTSIVAQRILLPSCTGMVRRVRAAEEIRHVIFRSRIAATAHEKQCTTNTFNSPGKGKRTGIGRLLGLGHAHRPRRSDHDGQRPSRRSDRRSSSAIRAQRCPPRPPGAGNRAVRGGLQEPVHPDPGIPRPDHGRDRRGLGGPRGRSFLRGHHHSRVDDLCQCLTEVLAGIPFEPRRRGAQGDGYDDRRGHPQDQQHRGHG